jgi:Amt family ammonium transporter
MKKKHLNFIGILLILLSITSVAKAEVSAETAYIFNTFSFLIHGILVMLMAAGFAMLEAGMVRTKNTAAICLKNIALYSIGGLMFYLIGYALMYPGEFNGILGIGDIFYDPLESEIAGEPNVEDGYSKPSDWFFQMVFAATAISSVSGAVAERVKVIPFLLFAAIMTAIIYPIYGSWTWGGGFLAEFGFSDFAGSTIVHSVGGWAALVGCLVIGARKGKYNQDGSVNALPGANLPLSTLGTFLLWFGWFGFNGGSQLALGSAADAAQMSIVYVNTNLAAAAGVMASIILAQIIYKKIDLTLALNGALAGLVAITAGPDVGSHFVAIVVGAIGGILSTLAIPLLDRFKIDDVVGAIPVHLVGGIWGTLAVAIFGGGSFIAQLYGIMMAGVLTVPLAFLAFCLLKYTVGLRVSETTEDSGVDMPELGLQAYPEFKH